MNVIYCVSGVCVCVCVCVYECVAYYNNIMSVSAHEWEH